jgi:hypothetical protein
VANGIPFLAYDERAIMIFSGLKEIDMAECFVVETGVCDYGLKEQLEVRNRTSLENV